MRRLRVFESISIDGYFCDAHGDMQWAHAGADDPEFISWVGGNASGGGELLFGRVTYDHMRAWWTTLQAAAAMPVVAKGMNAATKWVASRSLQGAGGLDWSGARLLDGDAVAAVRALKQSGGPGITLLGSGSLAAQLGAAGLVDEYQLVIVPVALGGGRTIFSGERKLALQHSRTFKNGRVVVTYAA
ncbi:MAG: dihydrofolate reductase family protein [Deltaproteobacteria bacterium]|nr:dihydrofolate reductase family protein [Deltaproteobacteria bacterium]